MTGREVTTRTRAEPSVGSQAPLAIHILDCGPVGQPKKVPDTALCGRPWDRFGATGPLCEGCKAEFRRRHPTCPFPTGGTS